MFTINNYEESAEIKDFGNTPRSKHRTEHESNKYSYDENSEVKYFGSQPKKKYRSDRTKNDADLHSKNAKGPDFGRHANVYFGKDYG